MEKFEKRTAKERFSGLGINVMILTSSILGAKKLSALEDKANSKGNYALAGFYSLASTVCMGVAGISTCCLPATTTNACIKEKPTKEYQKALNNVGREYRNKVYDAKVIYQESVRKAYNEASRKLDEL